MTKRMLIDATHTEETRVVVLDGSRLEDFDVETSSKKQLKGNIYLAKIVRVEPSLQAAFVEYGGNRHGFLAFGEIHPDYYQIPVADRQRLVAMQEEEARREDEADIVDEPEPPATVTGSASDPVETGDAPPIALDAASVEVAQDVAERMEANETAPPPDVAIVTADEPHSEGEVAAASEPEAPEPPVEPLVEPLVGEPAAMPAAIATETRVDTQPTEDPSPLGEIETIAADAPPPETVGGSEEEPRERRIPQSFLRNYKIQEVIRRRQILLVQVVKEERGGKGAALTTYISLAGRFCVLMPNSPRGGGISRKITSAADRRRLKEITAELDIPKGMGMIVRTAGAARPKPEIRRDCEYLLRLWDDIRDTTMASVAPALIHEEASLIKRAIRDVYSRDIDEVVVDGDSGWQAAHDYMRMLMPGHQRKVIAWRETEQPGGQPLFAKHQVEAQLDSMLSPNVQLRSGGYLVINQTEALVAIDVNSGRSTRERGIEETAVRTNLEAADEVARQLRLRDLAGLIVIDFIDMESKKHNAQVERRLKEGLKTDRARIQVGHISHFGLMEMSRQRLRPSLAETSFIPCPHCDGTGHVRGTDSAAIHVLRRIEEEGAKRQTAEVLVHANTAIALYILNHKRDRLAEMERRYGMKVMLAGDDALIAPQIRLERLRTRQPGEEFEPPPASMTVRETVLPVSVDDEVPLEEDEEESEAGVAEASVAEASGEDGEQRKRKRRKRRRGGKRDEADATETRLAEHAAPGAEQPDIGPMTSTDGTMPLGAEAAEGSGPEESGEERSGRRRGRRGGRRRRAEEGMVEPEAPPPPYLGPTPADPFGAAFDLFDVLEQAEQASVAIPISPLPPPPYEPVHTEPEPSIAAMDATPVVAPIVAEPAGPAPNDVGWVEAAPAADHSASAASAPSEHPAAEPVPPANGAVHEAEAVVAEPVSEPVVKPVLVGEAEPGEKRRGWWRR